ncbi:hypothetical protein ACWDYH_05945 [Nocardia goodfellowii]
MSSEVHVVAVTAGEACPGFAAERMVGGKRTRASGHGAQRIVRLGEAGPSTIGNPHDAMYPLHRFVHWVAHEDGVVPA